LTPSNCSPEDRYSIAWERTDKTKNGNTNDFTLPQKGKSLLDVNINTTHISNVELGSANKKVVNFVLREVFIFTLTTIALWFFR
jgi:hypothetical protein